MNKILTIAWKEIYITFTDRNLILILFAAPLALSLIIGLAFGGGGGGISLADIPVAVINLDTGADQNGQALNNGETVVDILIPANEDERNSLHELIDATIVAEVEEARAGVESGDYVAAIIIPADFTESQLVEQSQYVAAIQNSDANLLTPTSVEVYANSGSPIEASVVRSVTESIVNQITTGNIAVAATIGSLIERALEDPAFGVEFLQASATGTFNPDFSGAFNPGSQIITVEQVPLTAVQEQSAFVQIMVAVGSAQAVFFALFNGGFGLLSIYDERNQWTLQRLLVSPMPRAYILIGKVLGNLLTVTLQIAVLLIAMTVITSILEGGVTLIFGTNWLLLVLTVIVIGFVVTAVGIIIVGLARTQEQANIFIPMVNMTFGVLGGAFGFALPVVVSQFSLIYWATDALTKLSNNNPDIGLNLLVLVGQGVLFFVVGSYLFNRRVVV